MNSTIEIEAKVLLTKEQYDTIVSYLGLERYRKSKQINYYIDSKDQILRKNEVVLRIREKDDFELIYPEISGKSGLDITKLNLTNFGKLFDDL